jgi:hypothetical protein
MCSFGSKHKVLVFGGRNEIQFFNDFWVFDLKKFEFSPFLILKNDDNFPQKRVGAFLCEQFFSTRFECVFASSPLVSSVFSATYDDKIFLFGGVNQAEKLFFSIYEFDVRKGELTYENTLETSGEDVKAHSKRVGRCRNTLETSGEDVKLHSKRVEKISGGIADVMIRNFSGWPFRN